MTEGSGRPAWLPVVVAAAERRALGEARYLWGARGGVPPPLSYQLEHVEDVTQARLAIDELTELAREGRIPTPDDVR